MRIPILSTLLLLLAAACFADPIAVDASGEGDGATSASGDDGDGGSEADDGQTVTSAGSASMGGTSVGDGTSSDDTSSDGDVDTGESDDGTPTCGALGEACCAGACDEGACHRDRCLVFAGAFAEPKTCDGCTEDVNGPSGEIPPSFTPFLGGCECPRGFSTSSPLPTTSDYCPQQDVLHAPSPLRFCEHSTLYATSDWSGAFVTSDAPGCQPRPEQSCIVAHPHTQSCECPVGAQEVVARTWTPCGDTGEDLVNIHICVHTDVPPLSFGGAYQTRWLTAAPPVCEAGNPAAGGACECPEGFTPEGLRITSPTFDQGGDLFLCVQY
jgi:hypothetical protein